MQIQFRPHHFLCALCFQGRGYSPAFVANFQAMMDVLNSPTGDATPIDIVKHTDSICEPCPNRVEKICATEEKISILDNAHANALAIRSNEQITWGKAKQAIAEKISLETFHKICATCSWKSLGICENVLTEFLEKYHSSLRGAKGDAATQTTTNN